jgi:uncharacterized protein involved in type VI secretion and phage assembly
MMNTEKRACPDARTSAPYYGKYRGVVTNNIDPMSIGRLQVQVPDVSGLIPTTWAMPCFPFSGKQMGAWLIPQVSAGVWVEFEHGDPNFPIWTGCWYGSVAEVPPLALAGVAASPNILLQSATQNALIISDNPAQGIMLKSSTGATIVINAAGILLQTPQGASVSLAGPTVTVNAGALVVT